MAKVLTLAEKLKTLPKAHIGAKRWRDKLTPEQTAEYEDFLKVLRKTPSTKWPSRQEILNSIQESFGTAPTINTLHKDVRGG